MGFTSLQSLSIALAAVSIYQNVASFQPQSTVSFTTRQIQQHGFSPYFPPVTTTSSSSTTSSSALYMGTNRRARRKSKKKQSQSRPDNFYKNIQEVADDDTPVSGATDPASTSSSSPPPPQDDTGSVVSSSSVSDAQASMDARPDVSTIVVDEETGIERIRQGKNVMDVLTRKAVQLSSLGPQYRLAQMFPGVPEETRQKHRFDWSTVTVPEIVQRFTEVAESETTITEDGSTTRQVVPEHPNLSDDAIDFVLANRDYLGPRMKKTLGRLKLRAQSQFQREETIRARTLWKHFLTIEDHLSAPFRQMMLDAEGRVGTNFGNLDLKSYCGGDAYERAACYLVLKGMVAHWEKKTRDAEYVESVVEDRGNFFDTLMVGDPKRYLPDPPIIYRYNECVRIALMAQNMTSAFVNEPSLFDDLPVELRFIEAASFVQGGTALRRFMMDEFCPAENVSPASLREGVRRLDVQLSNMQIDPYGDLKIVVGRLCDAIAVGTDDARDPYEPYLLDLSGTGPGYFQTYTFDHDRQSIVSFLDNAKDVEGGEIGSAENVFGQLSNEATQFLNFGGKKSTEKSRTPDKKGEYVPPESRACGRPYNLGWLDLLGDEEVTGGKKQEATEEEFDSDNWREMIQNKQR